MLRATFHLCFLVTLLCAAAPLASAASGASEGHKLNAVGNAYFEDWKRFHPIRATFVTGDPRFDAAFAIDITEQARATERAALTRSRDALAKIKHGRLSPSKRIEYEALRFQVNTELDALGFDFHLTPVRQFFSPHLSLIRLGGGDAQQPFKTVRNYDDWLKRASGFPGWVDAAIANMRKGIAADVVQPKVVVERVLPQLASQVVDDPERSTFYQPIAQLPADFPEAEKSRLTAAYRKLIGEQLVPAFARLHDFMANEYLPRCRDTAGLAGTPGGRAKYALLVRQATTTNLAPEDIHQLGLKEVARIRGEMESVQARLGFKGDFRDFLRSLNADPALHPFKSEDEVVQAFEQLRDRIMPRMPQLFGRLPRAALDVRPVEPVQRKTAAAHYNPPAPDGSRPGIFYIPVPEPEKFASFTMTALFLHEGAPGHHFEVSLKQESPLPDFRRFAWIDAYGEGWALYTEGLGKELGLYDDAYAYLGRLQLEMHRAVRLVVDTGLHAKGWSRQQAIEFSIANEAIPEAQIAREVERYMALPGQALAYKIGELKILELRRKAEKRLGPTFDIKAFHDEILKDGQLPLTVLEAKMDTWLARQR